MSIAEIVGIGAGVLAFAFFAVLSVVLSVVDARTHRLPDRLVLPAYPVAAVLLVTCALCTGTPDRLVWTLVGALGLFAFYLALRMLRPGAMGGGDVKLAGVTGAYLGFLGADLILIGAALGFVLGGVYGLVLIAARRASASTAIAFGPFLLAGAWATIVGRMLPALL